MGTESARPLHIIIDGGNTDVKGMVLGRYGHEIVFPHYVDTPTDAVYENAINEYVTGLRRYRATDTVMFRSGDQAFVVGQRAAKVGKGRNMRGASKYTREQMGALVKAALYKLVPAGHPNVHLTVLHPADITAHNLRSLIKSVAGKHRMIMPDKGKVEYNVTKVFTDIEPVAGFQTFLLNTDGGTYVRGQMNVHPGMRFLVCDVGGALTSFVPVYITDSGEVDIDTYGVPVIRSGITNVYDTLKIELKSTIPQLGNVQHIDEYILGEAVSTDVVTLKNRPVECAEQVERAMQTVADPIRAMYQDRYSEGNGYNGVIVTGGGGGVAYNYLRDRVFEHDFCFMAEEELGRMRFSNIRGSSKGMANFLASMRI